MVRLKLGAEEMEGYDLDLAGGMTRYPVLEEIWLEVLEMEGMTTALWMEDMT